MGDSSTKQLLPSFEFDYDAVSKMVKPTNIEQFSQEAPVLTETKASLQAEAALEQQETVIPKTRKVLRTGDLRREQMMQRVNALAAAAVVGIAGATMTDNAEASGKKDVQQVGAVLGAAVINNVLLQKSPVGVKIDSRGNPDIVAKSPQELAINLAPRLEPGVLEYAQAIGLNVINAGMVFQIQNNNNPAEQISFTKYHSPTHYTTSFGLRKAPGGGIQLYIQFIKDGTPKAELVTIRTDANGKMGAVSVGN
jgi:hypothetical protein